MEEHKHALKEWEHTDEELVLNVVDLLLKTVNITIEEDLCLK